MSHPFKVVDPVRWNSEAGMVSGRIIKVHTRDTAYKGHMRRGSPEDPQYEIQSDKTDHIAMHKGGALHRIVCAMRPDRNARLSATGRFRSRNGDLRRAN